MGDISGTQEIDPAIEYFRVATNFTNDPETVYAFTYTTDNFYNILDDTPANREKALDSGFPVQAIEIYDSPNSTDPPEAIETFELSDEARARAGGDTHRQRVVRHLLMISGFLTETGGKPLTKQLVISSDKEVILPNGDKVPAKEVIKVGDVIGLHLEELEVEDVITKDKVAQIVKIKANVPIIRLMSQVPIPINVKGQLSPEGSSQDSLLEE